MQFVFGSKQEQPWWWCRKAQFESQKILYRDAWCVMPGLQGRERGWGLVGLAAGPIKTLHVCNSALKAKTLPQARLDLMMMMISVAMTVLWWLNGRNWVAGIRAKHSGAKWDIKLSGQSLLHLQLSLWVCSCPMLLHSATCFDSTCLMLFAFG